MANSHNAIQARMLLGYLWVNDNTSFSNSCLSSNSTGTPKASPMAVPSNISLFNYRIHNDLNCDFCLHLCLHEEFVVF